MREDGYSHLDHWQKAEKLTGRTPKPLLNMPTFPRPLAEMWALFNDLSRGREQGFDGPATLSWNIIYSYCILMNKCLSAYELDVIKRLDSIWLDTINEAKK